MVISVESSEWVSKYLLLERSVAGEPAYLGKREQSNQFRQKILATMMSPTKHSSEENQCILQDYVLNSATHSDPVERIAMYSSGVYMKSCEIKNLFGHLVHTSHNLQMHDTFPRDIIIFTFKLYTRASKFSICPSCAADQVLQNPYRSLGAVVRKQSDQLPGAPTSP